jgi:hypothetical protein
MSKPKDDWFKPVVWVIRNYPARKKEYEELHRQAMAFQMSGMPGSCDVSRTVENLALREMAPMKQTEYEAVTKAIAVTNMLPDGELRVKLITKMYWGKKKVEMKYIYPQLNIAESTATRWHGSFVRLVGEFMGYTR